MRRWINRGFNVMAAFVMVAILVKGPAPDRFGWTVQFALFGLAGFNAGWWVCAKYVRDMAKLGRKANLS